MRHGPGTRKSRGFTGNVGRSRATHRFKIKTFSCILTKNLHFILYILNLSQQLTHNRRIPSSLMHRQFINPCWSCSICFFSQQILLNSSICLAIFRLSLLEESSIQAYFVSFSLSSPLISLLWLFFVEIRTPD